VGRHAHHDERGHKGEVEHQDHDQALCPRHCEILRNRGDNGDVTWQVTMPDCANRWLAQGCTVMSDHNVTRATSRSPSGGRRQDDVPLDDFGFPPFWDDPSLRKSSLTRLAKSESPTDEDDVPSPRTGGPVSSCLLCLYGIPLLNVPKGPPGDPIGLCKTCSSMSCGWHGARTPPPAFICIICDTNNLLASAGWDDFKAKGGLDRLPHRPAPGARGEPSADAPDDAATELAQALAALFSTADGDPGPVVVATLEQWFAERPQYDQFRSALDDAAAWAVQVINRWFGTMTAPRPSQGTRGHYGEGAVRSLWDRLGDNGRQLLAAAVLLILALDLQPETLPPPVVDVAQLLGMRLRDFPDKISELQRQVKAQL